MRSIIGPRNLIPISKLEPILRVQSKSKCRTSYDRERSAMSTVSVRYIVDDVEASVVFYTTHLGFRLLTSTFPAFADVTRGDLRLLLSGPTSSAGRPLSDGRRPVTGGWNRIHLIVEDLTSEVERLRRATRSNSFSRPRAECKRWPWCTCVSTTVSMRNRVPVSEQRLVGIASTDKHYREVFPRR